MVASGGGKNGAPLISNGVMRPLGRWAWVRCRACRANDDDPPYEKRHRSPEEILQRAKWADAKVAYIQEPKTKLARIKLNTPTPATPASTPPPDNSAQLTALIETVTRLSTQVGELLAENARLRTLAASPSQYEPPGAPEAPKPVPTPPRKRKTRQIAKAS